MPLNWGMASWTELKNLAPELAEKVESRFNAHGLGLLATVRANGFPRVSGIEPLFAGELWLGMMHNSRKAADLMRNPRLCLHSATEDKEVKHGDAKVTGRGVIVEDEEALAGFRREFAAHTGLDLPPGPMHLFRVDVAELSYVRPGGDHLVIEWWREGQGPQQVKRY